MKDKDDDDEKIHTTKNGYAAEGRTNEWESQGERRISKQTLNEVIQPRLLQRKHTPFYIDRSTRKFLYVNKQKPAFPAH